MYGIPVITAGDMLRKVASKGTRMGKITEDYMRRGELVPDYIVIGVMEERMNKPDIDNGFVLDGFPRSVRQAMALDNVIKKRGTIIDIVLNVIAKPETIVSRLSLRRSCPQCGSIYHLRDKLPREPGICDECGSELIQRFDDEKEIIRKRFEVYEKQTFPILEWYEKRGKVKEISGELEIDQIPEVLKRILEDC